MAASDVIHRVAEAIAKETPPQWLSQWLQAMCAGLQMAIREEAEYPGRPELRTRLVELAEAAKLVDREMHDSAILSLLLVEGTSDIEHPYELVSGLRDVVGRADSAVGRIPVGPGKNKHYPRPDGLPNMDKCALVVAIAWEKLRGDWPPVNNAGIHQACDALWQASGGSARFGSLAVWRDHLRNATDNRESSFAIVIRDGLEKFSRASGA